MAVEALLVQTSIANPKQVTFLEPIAGLLQRCAYVNLAQIRCDKEATETNGKFGTRWRARNRAATIHVGGQRPPERPD